MPTHACAGLTIQEMTIKNGAVMKIDQFLALTDVLVDVRAADKAALLRSFAARAAAATDLPADQIFGDLMKREGLGSTGLGEGVAIPHTRLAGLAGPYGILARFKRGLDFEAIDDKPVDLVFMLLLPADAQGEQLHALAGVSRKLRDKDAVRRMRGAQDAAALYAVITA